MPISAIVQRCWMAVWPYCITEFFLEGKLLQRGLMGDPVQEVIQVSEAKMKLLEIAAAHVHDEAQSDSVFGLEVEWGDSHLGFRGMGDERHTSGDTRTTVRSATSCTDLGADPGALMTGPSPGEALRKRMLAGQAASVQRLTPDMAPRLACPG